MSTMLNNQVLRFLVIGVLNVGFTLSLFSLLSLNFEHSVNIQVIYWASSLIGIINGFIWQRVLVWKKKSNWKSEFVKFITLNLAISCINSALLALLVQLWGWSSIPSQILITVVLVTISFIANKFWVFTSQNSSKQDHFRESSAPKIHVFLQYYLPHVSGLTNMAAELAEFAVQHSYEVVVNCVGKQNGQVLLNGVQVHRHKQLFSIGRGNFSFGFIRAMWKLRLETPGIVHVHMPLPESFLLAWFVPQDWKIICTYQCDAPRGSFFDNVISWLLDLSHKTLFKKADAICFSSKDYAVSSRLFRFAPEEKTHFIPATSRSRNGGEPKYRIPGKSLVGFIGRPTTEKGINVLLDAMLMLPKNVSLLFAGPSSGLSEKAKLNTQLLSRLQSESRFIGIGFLEEEDIANFYSSLDVFAFPSTNSFEAFGIVQVESISAGTPVVASSLPGVRTIVEQTHYGEIFSMGNSSELARAILKAINGSYDYSQAQKVLEELYASPAPQNAYLDLFSSTMK